MSLKGRVEIGIDRQAGAGSGCGGLPAGTDDEGIDESLFELRVAFQPSLQRIRLGGNLWLFTLFRFADDDLKIILRVMVEDDVLSG